MILFGITVLFPIWNMLVISFSAKEDISFMSVNLFPKHFELGAYAYCFQNDQFYHAFVISVLRTSIGMVYHVLLCACAAYSLSRMDLPFRKIILFYLLIPMFISGGLIPTYVNMKNLGLLNNFLVYVLPVGFSIYDTIILKNYFLSLDRSLEEAATVDGASYFRIFFQIIFPLATPILATIALWSMVSQWNAWFDNLIYCRQENLLTLQYLLRKMIMETEALTRDASIAMMDESSVLAFNSENIRSATTILIILPIVLVYPFLQKYLVKGMMAGAIKG